jgi:SAM-dependent methyltransferase
MQTRDKEEIRQAVRERYGNVARSGDPTALAGLETSCCGKSGTSTEKVSGSSCCGKSDTSKGNASAEPCCDRPEITSQQLSTLMGYSKEDIDSVPDGANMGLGCGNPVALASLKPGETVVDLGSGGGFDCFLAAKQVGDTGRVIGVDMTPDMVSKARANAKKIGANTVEFRLGEIEHLPLADNSADIIMSNCVINLSPDKQQVYGDAFRALKPGGRLAISDVVATAPLPAEIQQDLALLSACVGGAATIDDTVKKLEKAGFQDIEVTPKTESAKLISEWGAGKSKNPEDYVVSADIKAVKPS